MKFFFFIPVLCLFAGIPAPGEETPPEKTVSVILLSAASETSWEPGIKKPERKFRVTLDFSASGFNKIVACRKEGIRLEIRDSTGAGGAPSRHDDFLSFRNSQFWMERDHWVPSAKACWMSVKGKVPLIIAEKEETAEGPLFSMDQKEEEQAFVLKGSALMEDGRQGDVKITVNMTCSPTGNSGKTNLRVQLKSPRILGITGLTLRKQDGAPVLGDNWYWGPSVGSGGACSWVWNYTLEPGEKGKMHVLVNYLTGLKQVDAPVDLKFGLFGMVRETSRQQER